MLEDSDSVDNRDWGERESREGSQVKHHKPGSASLPAWTNLPEFWIKSFHADFIEKDTNEYFGCAGSKE